MDTLLAVLAEPTRRRMLDALRQGERSAGELERLLALGQPMTSRHLRVLREAGLVQVRKEAQRRIYALDPRPLAELDGWLARYRPFWSDALDALARHVEREI
jgi:DNA-binding transcriptional ArsR family regulator